MGKALSSRVAAVVLLAAGAASASVPDVIGLGARSAALAGTGVSYANGYEATWLNPAGLVEAPRARVTLGWVLGDPSLRLDGAARTVETTSGALIGAALPLPFTGALRERVALGLGLYIPGRVLNRAHSPYPDVPRLALLETRTQVVSALASLSVRLTDRLSAGLGLEALATLLGEIHLQPDAQGHIVSVTDERMVWATAPIAGLRARIADSLRLGLTLRGASAAGYDLRITNSLGSTLPIGVPMLRLAGSAQYDPLQAQVEGSWAVREGLLLALGVTWKRWSELPLPTENATPRTPAQPPSGYHDTLVPRAALEATLPWQFLRTQLRAGYLYESSPAPPDAPVLVDAGRHVFSLGLGLDLGRAQLELFGAVHALAGSPRAQGRLLVGGASLGLEL